MERKGARELMRRCATRRDPALWQEFRSRFETRLVAGLRRGLRRTGLRHPPVELEDLLQDVYCKLLDNGGRNLMRCRGQAEEAVSAYLGRVAESVAIDRVRAEVAAKRGRGRVVSVSRQNEGDAIGLPATEIGPEQRLLRRERCRIFLRRCREVVGPRTPRRDLRVLYLAYVEGWSSREIAGRVGEGLTPSSIDSLVHRTRKRLEAKGIGVPGRRQPLEPAWV